MPYLFSLMKDSFQNIDILGKKFHYFHLLMIISPLPYLYLHFIPDKTISNGQAISRYPLRERSNALQAHSSAILEI